MRTISVRGAITIDKNDEYDIVASTKDLLQKMLSANSINQDNVVSIIFTATEDLDSIYPAQAARSMGFTHCGLMCLQEMKVHNSLEKCIRVMILANSDIAQSEIIHVYLKNAANLRPDLASQ